jgi:NAD(P)-dependent dehydrogenase (short-subunit alcohol dehydrogenase family)
VVDPARTVVVTGGSRGLGRGLVEAFLARGCNVAFCARSESSVGPAQEALEAIHPGRVLGLAIDVARYEEVVRLWDAAKERFGGVVAWINNAGTSNAQRPFVELPPGDIGSVVSVNLVGTMNGARIALERMRAQGHGHVFTMEGYGSDGAVQSGMAIYGSTKVAIRYLTRSLVLEARGGPVKVSSLSPGIVVTDLLVDVHRHGDPAKWEQKRWLFNVIADPVEVVAPWLAARVLEGPRHGAHVAWMTVPKAVLRMLTPSYHRRDLFGGRLPGPR